MYEVAFLDKSLETDAFIYLFFNYFLISQLQNEKEKKFLINIEVMSPVNKLGNLRVITEDTTPLLI